MSSDKTITIPIEEYNRLIGKRALRHTNKKNVEWLALRKKVHDFLSPRVANIELVNGSHLTGNTLYTFWLTSCKLNYGSNPNNYTAEQVKGCAIMFDDLKTFIKR